MALANPAELQGKLINNRYEITGSPQHTGGFAHIYKAEDRNVHNRLVAVKVLRGEYATNHKWRKLFIDEALSLEQVKSGNVVVVHDCIENEATTQLDFIVMEWVNGRDLGQYRLSRSEFDTKHLLRLSIEIVKGLHGIHNKSLIHGDITPKNIMVREPDSPVIIDFGLAWDLSYGLEVEKELCGTVSYLAPEQFRSKKDSGIETDIFSLGAVLYFWFSGKHYFPELREAESTFLNALSKSAASTVSLQHYYNHFSDLFANYRQRQLQLGDDFPRKLQAKLNGLVHRMLDMEPQKRPSSKEILAELEHIYDAASNKMSIFPLEALDYSIVVLDHHAGMLLDNRSELAAVKHGSDWRYESPALYLAPNQTRCLGVLIRSERVIFSGEFEVDEQPFRFFTKPSQVGEMRELHIDRGRLIGSTTISLADCEIQHEVSTRKWFQLALLIDGTIGEDDFRVTLVYIDRLLYELSRKGYETRVSVGVYGEYKHIRGEKRDWNIPFDLLRQDFDSVDKTRLFLWEKLRNSGEDFEHKGYSGCLEYGLDYLNSLEWLPEVAKHVVVVGTSPPHPNLEERERFELTDITIEEYLFPDAQASQRKIPHWKTVLEEGRARGIQTHAVWVKPSDFSVVEEVQKYIHSVWSELNQGEYAVLESTTQGDLSYGLLAKFDETVKSFPMIEEAVRFPFTKQFNVLIGVK